MENTPLLHLNTQQVTDDIDLLKSDNVKLRRIIQRLDYSFDTPENHKALEKTRKHTNELCKRVMMALKEGNTNNSIDKRTFNNLSVDFQAAFQEFRRLCEDLERKENHLISISKGTLGLGLGVDVLRPQV